MNRKKRGWGFYALLLCVLAGGVYYFGTRMRPHEMSVENLVIEKPSLHVDKILAQSELKDRKFHARVQEIGQNGLTGYLLEEHANPIVSVSFVFQNAGMTQESDEKQGLSNILAEVLLLGDYEERPIKEWADEYGIKMDFYADADDFGGYLQFPSAHKQMAVNLFVAALSKSNITLENLRLVRRKMWTALQIQQEKPEYILENAYKENIFAGHPYERNVLGTKDSVGRVYVVDLRDFRHTYLAKDNLLVGVAGDVNRAQAEKLLAELFGQLPEKAVGKPMSRLSLSSDGSEYKVARQTPQVIATFSAQGVFRDSKEFYPLYIANYIFGDSGLNSRLSKIIREKEGLTYGIYTVLDISDAAALIKGHYAATPANFAKAKELLLREWQRLGHGGISEEELQEAKKSLISAFNLRFASTDGIADMLVAMLKYRLGRDFLDKRNDYIAAVTLDEVNAAAQNYFSSLPDFVYIGIK